MQDLRFFNPMAAFAQLDLEKFWQGYGMVLGVAEPVAKEQMRVGLEVIGLAASRTRAALELPQHLARCRTPQDVAAMQARLWQDAGQQYVTAARHIAAAWQGLLVPVRQADTGAPAARPTRDLINIPDSEPTLTPAAQARSQPELRVA